MALLSHHLPLKWVNMVVSSRLSQSARLRKGIDCASAHSVEPVACRVLDCLSWLPSDVSQVLATARANASLVVRNPARRFRIETFASS